MNITAINSYTHSLKSLKTPKNPAFKPSFTSYCDSFEYTVPRRYDPKKYAYPDTLFNAMGTENDETKYYLYGRKGQLVRIAKKQEENDEMVFNCAEVKDDVQVSQTQYDEDGQLRFANFLKNGTFNALKPEIIENGKVVSYRLETNYQNGASKIKVGKIKELDPSEPLEDVEIVPESVFLKNDDNTIAISQAISELEGWPYIECCGYEGDEISFRMSFTYEKGELNLKRYEGPMGSFHSKDLAKIIKKEGFKLD